MKPPIAEMRSNVIDEPVRGWHEAAAVRAREPSAAPGLPVTPSGMRRNALAVCLGLLAGCYAVCVAAYAWSDTPIHMDFFGIWSWARFEIEQPPARIYDHAAQHAFLLSLDPRVAVQFPFPYPPPYLLLIRPLGWLSYPAAYAVWCGATLAAYAAALWGREARSQTVLLGLLAPASAVNLLYGQNGFLTAALLVGGIRLAPSRPVLAGVLLGLMSYKPQFGLLVAIALAAAALWRVALVAALTVALLVAASLFAFGVEPWTAWIHAMPEFVAIVDAQRARLLHLMPTALSNALALGASERLALIIQGAVAIAAAGGVWYAFRRKPGRTGTAVLAVASVLASPYAFVYDLPLVAAAVALFATSSCVVLSAAEMAVLAAAMLLPAAMLLNVVPPVATLVHGAVFAIILLHLRRAAPADAPAKFSASSVAIPYGWASSGGARPPPG